MGTWLHWFAAFQLLSIVWLRATNAQVSQLVALDVKCDEEGMNVRVEFDGPFNGIIYSKGYYKDPNCRYVEANGNNRSHNFIIKRKSNCSLEESRPTDNEPGMRSYGITLIIQHDPSFVDSHDLSRQLQCNWFRHLRRTITHSPIPVLSLAESRLAYPGEQVNVWMDVQRGDSPFSPLLNGDVPIGEKLTISLYLEDKTDRFDLQVRRCHAYDGRNFSSEETHKLAITDRHGCSTRPQLFESFFRLRHLKEKSSVRDRLLNEKAKSANVLVYGVLNAFRFPERESESASEIFLACNIEICANDCENPCQPEVVSPDDLPVTKDKHKIKHPHHHKQKPQQQVQIQALQPSHKPAQHNALSNNSTSLESIHVSAFSPASNESLPSSNSTNRPAHALDLSKKVQHFVHKPLFVDESSNQTEFEFSVTGKGCGTEKVFSEQQAQTLENILIIQNDPAYQDEWDLARLIACRHNLNQLPDLMQRRVVFRPYLIDNLEVVSVPMEDEGGDRKVDLWMDITYGIFPDTEVLDRPVKVGDNLTLAIYVKDTSNSTDIRVKDCYAYDNAKGAKQGQKPAQLQLTEENGCPIREKLLGVWRRTLKTMDSGASLIAYNTLRAFKFPGERESVFLACNIDLCKDGCQERCNLEPSNPDDEPEEDGNQQVGQQPQSKQPSPDYDDSQAEPQRGSIASKGKRPSSGVEPNQQSQPGFGNQGRPQKETLGPRGSINTQSSSGLSRRPAQRNPEIINSRSQRSQGESFKGHVGLQKPLPQSNQEGFAEPKGFSKRPTQQNQKPFQQTFTPRQQPLPQGSFPHNLQKETIDNQLGLHRHERLEPNGEKLIPSSRSNKHEKVFAGKRRASLPFSQKSPGYLPSQSTNNLQPQSLAALPYGQSPINSLRSSYQFDPAAASFASASGDLQAFGSQSNGQGTHPSFGINSLQDSAPSFESGLQSPPFQGTIASKARRSHPVSRANAAQRSRKQQSNLRSPLAHSKAATSSSQTPADPEQRVPQELPQTNLKFFSNQQLPNQAMFNPAQSASQTPLSNLPNTLPESAPILPTSSSFEPISPLQSAPKKSYQFPVAPLYALPPPPGSLTYNEHQSKTLELMSSATAQSLIEKSQQQSLQTQTPLSTPNQHSNFLPPNQVPSELQSKPAVSTKSNKYRGRKVVLKKSKNLSFISKSPPPAINAAPSSPTAPNPLKSANAHLPLHDRNQIISEVTNEAQTAAVSIVTQPKYSYPLSQLPTTHAGSPNTGDNFGSRLSRAL